LHMGLLAGGVRETPDSILPDSLKSF
jgi:hypothetical protein